MALRQSHAYRTRAVARLEQGKGQQVWIPELVERIASFLPRNELALTVRLVNKATAQLLSQHRVLKASEPMPAHALLTLAPAQLQQLRNHGTAERRQLVRSAARSGSLEAVDAALEATQLSPGAWLLSAAAGGTGPPGTALALCKRLFAIGCPVADKHWRSTVKYALADAASAGNSDVCEWLLATGRCRWKPEPVYAAARAGHVVLVQQLLARCPEGSKREFSVAKLLAASAHGYDLAALEALYIHWLGPRRAQQQQQQQQQQLDQQQQQLGQQQEQQQQQQQGLGQQAAPQPAFGGADEGNEEFGVHEWPLPAEFGPAYDERRSDGFACHVDSREFARVLAAAAGSAMACWLSKLDSLLLWHCGTAGAALLARGRYTLPSVFGAAMGAADGLSRVRAMWEQRGWRPQDLEPAAAAAAARGDLEALRYLFGPLRASIKTESRHFIAPCAPLTRAAEAGHLAALQLLMCTYGVGCYDKPHTRLVEAAAKGGHTEVIRWLFEVAVPLVADAVVARWEGDRERVLKSIRYNAALSALDKGVCGGHPTVVCCALQLGVAGVAPGPRSGTNSWTQAVLSGSVATLQALAESGYVMIDADLYDMAAAHPTMLRTLARLRCRGPGAHRALLALLEDPDVPLSELRWLLEGEDGGQQGAAVARASRGSGAAGGSAGGRAAGCCEGPAAEAMRYMGEWERAVEAVRQRGRGREAREIRAWLQAWRQAQYGRMVMGDLPTYVAID